jgi:hypothetical protein
MPLWCLDQDSKQLLFIQCLQAVLIVRTQGETILDGVQYAEASIVP